MSMHNLYFLNGKLTDHFLKDQSQAQWLKNPEVESSSKKKKHQASLDSQEGNQVPSVF